MALAKRKEPAPDLAGEIMRVRALIDAYIDGQVSLLKASRDGASQPPEVLRHMLTRGDSCLCRAAVNILAEQSRE